MHSVSYPLFLINKQITPTIRQSPSYQSSKALLLSELRWVMQFMQPKNNRLRQFDLS